MTLLHPAIATYPKGPREYVFGWTRRPTREGDLFLLFEARVCPPRPQVNMYLLGPLLEPHPVWWTVALVGPSHSRINETPPSVGLFDIPSHHHLGPVPGSVHAKENCFRPEETSAWTFMRLSFCKSSWLFWGYPGAGASCDDLLPPFWLLCPFVERAGFGKQWHCLFGPMTCGVVWQGFCFIGGSES